MRAVILILIVAVVALIIADPDRLPRHQPDPRRRGADINASANGVTATGGQTPAFDVETGTVAVGTSANVTVAGADARSRARRGEPGQRPTNAAPVTGNAM